MSGGEVSVARRRCTSSASRAGNTSLHSKNLSDPDIISLKVDFHDELPMTAYLDTGFEIWLYHHTSD